MTLAGIPLDFILFALTLLGVALFHNHTLFVAVTGMIVIALYKILFGDFSGVTGVHGLGTLLAHEWVTLGNLLGLLLGFALLADHFERSHVTDMLPNYLPDDWKGGFLLLVLIAVISSFLDNIAAAMIGGAMAHVLYRGKVHVGFLAAIVAASNAGGAGSVVGDTTTTMMWIAGVRPGQVFEAYVGAGVALLFFGTIAARQQQAYQPIMKDNPRGVKLDLPRLGVVALMLLAAIFTNITLNIHRPDLLNEWPLIGLSVWVALLVTAGWRTPTWSLLPGAFRGSVFLLSLVMCAAMMPVKALPGASWPSALGLGFVSAVFDNIPLTALALRQGGYDWGFVAYAVGFGGSMIWFGSSAGVALCNMYHEGRSVGAWLKGGWHVAVGYVLGFIALMLVLGWEPEADVGTPHAAPITTHSEPAQTNKP
ncbi:citrate transporter [Ramlibacter ginsenosidimutans]|uniref:Citrate transporter n=1 Tax=Ramlibacter ginsenosidimutans TaxID=502333 RepID=A0A934WPH2_9BURK|nr:citrate transporter [Ramlibacter ginsenosidimutans]MBK6008192.1 citrate transporter [Ramlibacter ginsenosidimutans]